jgi:hypothetical protein
MLCGIRHGITGIIRPTGAPGIRITGITITDIIRIGITITTAITDPVTITGTPITTPIITAAEGLFRPM